MACIMYSVALEVHNLLWSVRPIIVKNATLKIGFKSTSKPRVSGLAKLSCFPETWGSVKPWFQSPHAKLRRLKKAARTCLLWSVARLSSFAAEKTNCFVTAQMTDRFSFSILTWSISLSMIQLLTRMSAVANASTQAYFTINSTFGDMHV